MTSAEAIASGVVQGLTEFFPVSSSGHLVLLHHLFGAPVPQLSFDLFLHMGTALAILIYFKEEIFSLFTKEKRFLGLLFWGFLPTGVIGFLFAKKIEALFGSPRAVSAAFLITALWLWIGNRHKESPSGLNVWKALTIGVSQGIAIAPGISRSGATVATALLLGVSPREAVRYSFLLAIPTIIVAFGYEVLRHPMAWGQDLLPLWLGFGVSFVVGLFAIGVLRTLAQKRRLYFFSLYLVVLGMGGLIYFR